MVKMIKKRWWDLLRVKNGKALLAQIPLTSRRKFHKLYDVALEVQMKWNQGQLLKRQRSPKQSSTSTNKRLKAQASLLANSSE